MPKLTRIRSLSRVWLAVSAALLALLVTLPNALGPEDALYPVKSDSLKYHEMGKGLARLVDELPQATGALLSGKFGREEITRYGLDSGILQHAASYVICLGWVYVGTGDAPVSGRLLTVFFLAAAAALLVFWTDRHFGRAAAILAGVLFAFWPAHVYFGTAIMTEVPILFYSILALVALDVTRESTPLWRPAVGGVMVGLTALVKTTFRPVSAVLLLLDGLAADRKTPLVRFVAARLVGVLLVLAIWSVFLRAAHLPASPMSSGGEQELWVFRGNYIPDRGFENVGLGDATVPELIKAVREHDNDPEAVREKNIFRSAFLTTIKADPLGWIALIFAKAQWFFTYPAVKEDVRTWFGSLPPPAHLQPFVVALSWLGFLVALPRGPAAWMPMLFVAYSCAVPALTHLVSRYNVSAIGLLFPYAALGAVTIAHELLRLRGWRPPRRYAVRPLLLAGAGLVAWLIGWVVPRDVWVGAGMDPNAAWGLGTLSRVVFAGLIGVSTFFQARRTVRKGNAYVIAILAGLVPAALFFGDRHADRDPDVWSARLAEPGDRIVQEIELPHDMNWPVIKQVELHVDLLPSLKGEPQVVVRVEGQEVERWAGHIPRKSSDFLLDPVAHAVQDRYAKVAETLERHEAHFVERRYPRLGLSYYPQWHRVLVPLDLIHEKTKIRIEIELETTTNGGYVEVRGDHEIRPLEKQEREVFAPAFLSNPFELSTYQMLLFASDRERGDVRLTRPIRLASPSTRAEFFRGGRSLGEDLAPRAGQQGGEYRIRVRTQLRGGYVYRDDPATPGKSKATWAAWPREEDRPVSGDDLRALSARRDLYFDGFFTY